jgi:hypothetical protein
MTVGLSQVRRSPPVFYRHAAQLSVRHRKTGWKLVDRLRVLLLGGTSHAGKSTLAQGLSERLGWDRLSTDSLARHPGRPWRTPVREVPPHVAEHYLSLSTDELMEDVLRHYRGLWPEIRDRIFARTIDGTLPGLIIEGSALWPDTVADFSHPQVSGVWLTASADYLRKRIHITSGFLDALPQEQILIQKFVDRTVAYNARMMAAVSEKAFLNLDVERYSTMDSLCSACVEIVDGLGLTLH